MAWYTSACLRYRGRLVEVTERYGRFMSAQVVKGKPLLLEEKDLQKIEALSLRGPIRKELDEQEEGIHDYLSSREIS